MSEIDQRMALVKSVLTILTALNIADDEPASLATHDGQIRRVLKPISVLKPNKQSMRKIRDLARHAMDLWVRDGLHNDTAA